MAVLSCEYFSETRKGKISFEVIIPVESSSDLENSIHYTDGPYPTIYLLHGYTGSRHDWLYRTRIEEWAQEHRIAVVMPDGANRFYIDNEETEEFYGEFIGIELVKITRNLFPLSQRREHTTIAGLSMGGYGALRNGLKYADTFGSVIALSSALIIDEIGHMKPGDRNNVAGYGYYRNVFGDLNKLIGSDKDPKQLAKNCIEKNYPMPNLFLACGSEDFLFAQNVDFHEYLMGIGYAHEWWMKSGAHDFDFWNKSLLVAMDWLHQSKQY